MPPLTLATALGILIALGLWNVWLLRATRSTAYRGGDASSLREEFQAYGLPQWAFYAIGALKIGAGASLLAGLWVPSLVLPAAGLVVALMLGALVMHVRIQDPPLKSVPAFLMLAMSLTLVVLRLG